MTMDFFLPRREQMILSDKLSGIPSLMEDLAITITRQARIQRSGWGNLRRQKPGSRLPFHIAAADAADELHNALSTWVRFVCEERQIHYTGHDDDITLSRWLRKHMVSLALTQGSDEAFDDIIGKIDECRRQVDLPPDDEVVIDRKRVEAANKSVVTLATISTVAGRLGDMGRGLNRDRLRLLVKHGDLRSVGTDPDTGTNFYRLGDVLHAHHNRSRKARAK